MHDAWCQTCGYWMEWRSAEWASSLLQLPRPSQERRDRDAWVSRLLAEGESPHVVGMLAAVLVHRKGYGSLWRYVTARARHTPTRQPDKAGNPRTYETPEVYVEKYSPEDHRIFFLLVLEELSNKCREAMMANDQDLAARGGWRPLNPPPMSTTEETRACEGEIHKEATNRHQEVVGGWAPSLRRAV